jgi:Protein of unknown function DUF115
MANVKIPYALIPAVAIDQRRTQMSSAMARGLPRLQRLPTDDSKTLHVACFGPSLQKTWQQLYGKSPIIAMSGSTKFLAERGIIADYAIEMDPRPSKVKASLPPVNGVHYLIASCVVPEYFDQVITNGNQITLWHTVNGKWEDDLKWVAEHDIPDQLVISTGSTIGLGAIQIGGVLGFTRFEIHGMDGSFGDYGERHAAFHGGKSQKADITWDAGKKTYHTSKIMANAVAETVNTAKNFPIVTIWHGDGLTQALIREANLPNAACIDETEKVNRLRGLRPQVVKTPPLPLTASFWDALIGHLEPGDLPELIGHIPKCEGTRALAKFNTGTIPFESSVYLRAICRFYRPDVVAEVGTFIGTSTRALNTGRVVYTCDKHNDCFEATESIITHPYQTSTQMFRDIQEPVDLFFFDGRIQAEDIAEIQRLMKPSTVFVLDDYVGHAKGVANVRLLATFLTEHALIMPGQGPSTLAMLVPFTDAKRE